MIGTLRLSFELVTARLRLIVLAVLASCRALALAGIASHALAAPSYFASAGVLSGFDQRSFTSPAPVGATAGGVQPFTVGGQPASWSGESEAQAGAGVLRVRSHTALSIADHQCCLGSGVRGSGSEAEFTIDDVVISGVGSSVAGSLNLTLSGSLEATATLANALGNSGSYGQISVGVSIPGAGVNGGARLGAGSPPDNTLTLTNSGLLSGYGGGVLALSIASPALPVNTPFTIQIELLSETLASYSVQGTGPLPVPIAAEGFARFDNSLSFAVSAPVFTLPAGYTVNSAAGAIVNNQYVGLVPEPASAWLGAASFCALVLRRRGSGRPC
jgi:hypothetical protein